MVRIINTLGGIMKKRNLFIGLLVMVGCHSPVKPVENPWGNQHPLLAGQVTPKYHYFYSNQFAHQEQDGHLTVACINMNNTKQVWMTYYGKYCEIANPTCSEKFIPDTRYTDWRYLGAGNHAMTTSFSYKCQELSTEATPSFPIAWSE